MRAIMRLRLAISRDVQEIEVEAVSSGRQRKWLVPVPDRIVQKGNWFECSRKGEILTRINARFVVSLDYESTK